MEGWEGINICRAGVSYISLGWASIRLPDGTNVVSPPELKRQNRGGGIPEARGQQGVGSFLSTFHLFAFCFVQTAGAAAKSSRIVFRARLLVSSNHKGKAAHKTVFILCK